MWALVFVAMWAQTGMAIAPHPMTSETEEVCVAMAKAKVVQVTRFYRNHPDGLPTAIHWWCVPTNEGGGAI